MTINNVEYQQYTIEVNGLPQGLLSTPADSSNCFFFGVPLWNSSIGFIDRLELTVENTKYVVAKLGLQ